MQVVKWLPKCEKWRTLIRVYAPHVPLKLVGLAEERIKWPPRYYGAVVLASVRAVCPVLTKQDTVISTETLKLESHGLPPWKSFVSFIEQSTTAVDPILEGVCVPADKPDVRIFLRQELSLRAQQAVCCMRVNPELPETQAFRDLMTALDTGTEAHHRVHTPSG